MHPLVGTMERGVGDDLPASESKIDKLTDVNIQSRFDEYDELDNYTKR